MQQRVLAVSEIIEVEPVENMGAAQVRIQLEGALKFTRAASFATSRSDTTRSIEAYSAA